MRIVADTNCLVSGVLWSGIPAQLLDAARLGKVTLLQTPALWLEFVEVLERPKFVSRLQVFRLTPAEVASALRSYITWAAEAPISPPPALRDPNDLVVLAAAAGGNAEAIVTGDDDLLVLREFQQIPILTPAECFARLTRKRE